MVTKIMLELKWRGQHSFFRWCSSPVEVICSSPQMVSVHTDASQCWYFLAWHAKCGELVVYNMKNILYGQRGQRYLHFTFLICQTACKIYQQVSHFEITVEKINLGRCFLPPRCHAVLNRKVAPLLPKARSMKVWAGFSTQVVTAAVHCSTIQQAKGTRICSETAKKRSKEQEK